MAPSFGATWRSFWHTMTSYDRHASHDSPYRTGQHMPLNQSRHAPLTTVATSAMDSRPDLTSPYEENHRTTTIDGWPGSPGLIQSPTSPYSPGMRSNLARMSSNENVNPFENVAPGEIQMQNFEEGLPPPPPVSHSWKRIERWVEDNYEELYDQISEGCTQNDINDLEHQLDCSLPLEVRESLQCHDGQERGGRPTGIVFGCMLLDCEEIVQEWKNWRVVNEEYLSEPTTRQHVQAPSKAFGGGAGPSSASVHSNTSSGSANPLWRQELLSKQDSQPPKAIQLTYAHPGWIPLARDWGGNNLAVDLAPGPSGKWGQIIIFGRDYDCKYVVARSWSAFLATVADDLGSEKVFVDEETQELKLREFKATGVEPAYLDILRWRMDQKYGRRGPKRKAGPNGLTLGSGKSGKKESPYGSPTEDRGRSPNRFPGNGPSSMSPRGTMKSSPLSQISDETVRGPTVRTRDFAMRNAEDTGLDGKLLSEKIGKLVEAPTPTVESKASFLVRGETEEVKRMPDEGEKNKENSRERLMGGPGLDGVGEMKDVTI